MATKSSNGDSTHKQNDKQGGGKGGISNVSKLVVLSGVVILLNLFLSPLVIQKGLNGATIGLQKNLDALAKERQVASERVVADWITKIPELARTTARHTLEERLPSEAHPFVFFHMRKGGGSAIRNYVYDAAKKNRWNAWIPCSARPCVPFSRPPADKDQKFALYASHINYVQTRQLHLELDTPAMNREERRSWESEWPVETIHTGRRYPIRYFTAENEEAHLSRNGTCLTNIRPTVSRVVSCWNYRMIKTRRSSWKLPPAEQMTADEWDRLLPVALDTYGNGCNNEVARIFGSTDYEPDINTLTIDNERFRNELERAISRIAGCVIIRVDRCEDTITILRYFLPWLKKIDGLCGSHQKQSKRQGSSALGEDAKQTILHHNQFDEMAFSFAERLFEEQLAMARAALEKSPREEPT